VSNDPNCRIELDPVVGPIRWTRFIEDNDRGDEDQHEPARWSVHATVLDPITMTDPVRSITWTHTVEL
jgi:hypothetical protein